MKLIQNLSLFALAILLSCNANTATKKQQEDSIVIATKKRQDSIQTAKKKADSISVSKAPVNKKVFVEDKTITVLEKAKTTKLLKFEFEDTGYNTWWREKRAERAKSFLYIKIKLQSKSKHGNKGGNFLPELNVFSVDKNTNSLSYIGAMDYQFFKKSDINVTYLEQIFDYKEAETFTCWIEVDSPLSNRIIISANKNKNKHFDASFLIARISK